MNKLTREATVQRVGHGFIKCYHIVKVQIDPLEDLGVKVGDKVKVTIEKL